MNNQPVTNNKTQIKLNDLRLAQLRAELAGLNQRIVNTKRINQHLDQIIKATKKNS